MISSVVRLSSRNLCVRWRRDKKCPDCGIEVREASTVVMTDACPKMWRKFNELDDRHCSLWANAEVAIVTEGREDIPLSKWQNMPRIIGRS